MKLLHLVRAAACATLACLAACGPRVVSRADLDYTGTPRRVFVIATPGERTLPVEWAALRASVGSALQACGLQVLVSADATPADNESYDRRLRAGDLRQFDTVLRLQPALVQINPPDAFGFTTVDSVRYEASVTDVASGKTVFQGLVWLRSPSWFRWGDTSGAEAGQALVRQISREHVLRSCPSGLAAADAPAGRPRQAA